MLTAIPAFPAYSYQPFRSSPLSMRDPNACSRMNPSHQTRTTPPSIATCKTTPFKRQSKYNSLLKDKTLERDKRRDLFLKKVKQSGDDKRWEARGEQVRILRVLSILLTLSSGFRFWDQISSHNRRDGRMNKKDQHPRYQLLQKTK